MRKNLYRGKTTSKSGEYSFNNVWIKGDLIVSDSRYYIHPKSNKVRVQGELGQLIVMHEVIPESVGECSFVPDKNGVMIFEGDIVEFESHGQGSYVNRGTVVFNDGCFGIEYYFYGSKFHRLGEVNKWQDMGASGIITYTYKVIGNISDNPELLAEAQE